MSRFESDAVWQWYHEHQRRFRKINVEAPESHRGRWQTARVALMTPAPLYVAPHFAPRNETAHYRMSEDWFRLSTFPRFESRQRLRQLLSWVPKPVAEELQWPEVRQAIWNKVAWCLHRHVVQADLKKVPPRHEAYRSMPVRFFRAQARQLLTRPVPPAAIVVYGRETIDEALDLLHTLDARDIHGWHGGQWWSVSDWAGVRDASQRSPGIYVCARLPGGQGVWLSLWHGRPRFAVSAAMPTGRLPLA